MVRIHSDNKIPAGFLCGPLPPPSPPPREATAMKEGGLLNSYMDGINLFLLYSIY
jgi:hypothetical protein